MSILRALTGAIGSHRDAPGDQRSGDQPRDTLALPRFLEVGKTLTISHAEISALYFVVEDYFEAEIDDAEPQDPIDEARALAQLLRGVIRRWNDTEPGGIYADLIELPLGALTKSGGPIVTQRMSTQLVRRKVDGCVRKSQRNRDSLLIRGGHHR